MKKFLINCLLAMTIIAFASAVSAAEWGKQKFEAPVLVTSLGQSPDALMVKVLMKRNKIQFTHNNLAQKDAIGQFKSVIMVVGFSGKGLGAAGISKGQELKRAKELLNEAKAKNVSVIMAHIGGRARMGPGSDGLVDLVAKNSDCLVYVTTPDIEHIFGNLIKKYNLPAKSATKISKTSRIFKELFQ